MNDYNFLYFLSGAVCGFLTGVLIALEVYKNYAKLKEAKR